MGWPASIDTIPSPPMQSNGRAEYSPLIKLAMRMGWLETGTMICYSKCKYIDAVKVDLPQKAYVFIVQNSGEAMTIPDDYHLFPSDALISKLKLLLP